MNPLSCDIFNRPVKRAAKDMKGIGRSSAHGTQTGRFVIVILVKTIFRCATRNRTVRTQRVGDLEATSHKVDWGVDCA